MNIWLQIGIALISVFIGVWLVQQIDNSDNSAWPRQISLGVRFGVIGLFSILVVMLQQDFGYIEVVGATGLAIGAMVIAHRSDASLDTLVKFALVIGTSVSMFVVLYDLCNRFIS